MDKPYIAVWHEETKEMNTLFFTFTVSDGIQFYRKRYNLHQIKAFQKGMIDVEIRLFRDELAKAVDDNFADAWSKWINITRIFHRIQQ